MIGTKALESKLYYQISLEQLVPADDFYRRLDRVLDLTFVREMCRPCYGTTGNPSLDPEVFFKIALVGYLENIVSDRELARRIQDSLALRLFLRYDLDEDLPWHSTISRTRQRIPLAVFEQVFQAVLTTCVTHNLVQGEHVAVDTTLIKANASMDGLERKHPTYSVGEYLRQVRPLHAPPTPPSNSTHHNRRDPDARIATKPGKRCDLYYKETLAVDPAHGIIVQSDAILADVNDATTLVPTVTAARERLAPLGVPVTEVSADKGYCHGEVLATLDQLAITAYIPIPERATPGAGWDISHFTYHPESDTYTCPASHRLTFQTDTGKSRRYRASIKACRGCAHRAQCTPSGRARMVYHPTHKVHFDALAARMVTPAGQRASRWRKTVERAFAELVTMLGLRKINTLGLGSARKQSLVAAVAYNLKKFLKYGYKSVVSTSRTKCLFNMLGATLGLDFGK